MNWLLAIPDHALRDALLERVVSDATSDAERAAIMSQLERANLAPAQKSYLTSLFPPQPHYEETATEPTARWPRPLPCPGRGARLHSAPMCGIVAILAGARGGGADPFDGLRRLGARSH